MEVDRKTLELIRIACRAGAFRAAARHYPDASATFRRAADVNSARVAALADQIATPGRCCASGDRAAR
ncbi:hypothetical protein [Synechococcus phage Yong-M4-211]|nr:hypothetical protein [Synechococcus phage Yong-M4-211]